MRGRGWRIGTPAASKLGTVPARLGLCGAACTCWVVDADMEPPGEARGSGGGLMGSGGGVSKIEV